MKEFTAKTVEDAVRQASEDFQIEPSKLIYKVTEEKKGLFKKSATIAVYLEEDAVSYAQEYLQNALKALGVEITTEGKVEDEIIKITINSERNSILIGRGGRTLQCLNELTKLAVSNKFRHRYRVLLDVGGYKEDKYDRVTRIAQRAAKDVLASHQDVQLDPMTPDERRVVHSALSTMEHIKTESTGEGDDRAIWIRYVD
ncbi:MAG TPA: protein jag [Firmicutes bacterium]|nr:protein jag [Bacillota bacterium]